MIDPRHAPSPTNVLVGSVGIKCFGDGEWLAEVHRDRDAANRESMTDHGLDAVPFKPNGEQTMTNIVELFVTIGGKHLENTEK